MTTDEFLALPDREKDALIAEKVMEWDKQAREDAAKAGYSVDFSGIKNLIPHYSTEIAAAWEVVEKLNGLEFHLRWDDQCDCYVAGFEKASPATGSAENTAPLAICLAALKAKGVIE